LECKHAPSVSRERRRVRRCQNEMHCLVHSTALRNSYTHTSSRIKAAQTCFISCKFRGSHLFFCMFAPTPVTPEHCCNFDSRAIGVNDCIRERLPTESLVRRCFMRLHCKRSVEQKHALPSPAFEATVIRTGENDGGIVLQLFIHVEQRRSGETP
jgi:hypothetical protein